MIVYFGLLDLVNSFNQTRSAGITKDNVLIKNNILYINEKPIKSLPEGDRVDVRLSPNKTFIAIIDKGQPLPVYLSSGRLAFSIDTTAYQDPVCFIIDNSYICLTLGALAIGVSTTKKSLLETYTFLMKNRRTVVFDLKRRKMVLNESTTNIGLPVAIKNDRLITLRVDNCRRSFLFEEKPRLSMAKVNLQTHRTTTFGKLNSISKGELEQLYELLFSNDDISLDYSGSMLIARNSSLSNGIIKVRVVR